MRLQEPKISWLDDGFAHLKRDSQLESDLGLHPVLEVGNLVLGVGVLVLVHEVLRYLLHDLGALLGQVDDAALSFSETRVARGERIRDET